MPYVDEYQVNMDAYFGGGCLVDASGSFPGTSTTGRITQASLCLGTHYNISIRARRGATWSSWSPSTNIVL